MHDRPGNKNYELLELANGKTVLPLMATAAEYLSELKMLINPAIVGVGPVEAAINTCRIIERLQITPDFVVLLGSAGSATLGQGEVYQASSVSYRDMDATPLGFAPGQTPFLEQPPIIHLPLTVPDIPSASLSTGGNIILTDHFDLIEQDMVDMESYAVQRVCQSYDLDLIVLRGISDGPKELKVYEDWTELLPTVDKNLATALQTTVNWLAKK